MSCYFKSVVFLVPTFEPRAVPFTPGSPINRSATCLAWISCCFVDQCPTRSVIRCFASLVLSLPGVTSTLQCVFICVFFAARLFRDAPARGQKSSTIGERGMAFSYSARGGRLEGTLSPLLVTALNSPNFSRVEEFSDLIRDVEDCSPNKQMS